MTLYQRKIYSIDSTTVVFLIYSDGIPKNYSLIVIGGRKISMRMPYYLLTKASFSTLANYAQDQNVITWSLLFKLFSALLSIVPIKCEERREKERLQYEYKTAWKTIFGGGKWRDDVWRNTCLSSYYGIANQELI